MEGAVSISDVICLGILVVDILVRPVDTWPAVGSLQFVDGLDVHSGGCALNTGTALHRLGRSVRVEGQVGNDILGDYLLRVLEERGMDSTGIRRVRRGTSGSIALVRSNGERTFLHFIGANRTSAVEPSRTPPSGAARHLHVGGAFLLPGLDGPPMATLLTDAHRAGMTTSVDTAYDFSGRWLDLIRPVLPHVDYFVPSYLEARALTGREDPADQAAALLDYGVGAVGIKLGEEGSLVATGGGHWRVAPLKVTPVDTTGAGDAWVAGFLDGILRGWPLPAAALWGNAQGAASVQAAGASSGIMDAAGLRDLLRRQNRIAELHTLGGGEGGD